MKVLPLVKVHDKKVCQELLSNATLLGKSFLLFMGVLSFSEGRDERNITPLQLFVLKLIFLL